MTVETAKWLQRTLREQVYVADGNTSATLRLEEAWSDPDAALAWKVAKLLIALDVAIADGSDAQATAEIVSEIEGAAGKWLADAGINGRSARGYMPFDHEKKGR